MEQQAILDELRDILVTRLRFPPTTIAKATAETGLPKGIDGSLGLDSLDFIELALALEERFGIAVPEGEGIELHFRTLGSLARFILILRR